MLHENNNPSNERQMRKLHRAIDWSHGQLAVFRNNRYTALKQYVGHNYSNDGSQQIIPVNLLEMALQTSRRSLVSAIPRVLITTIHGRLKGTAMRLDLAVNDLLREINFADPLANVVMDALLSIGIMKTGINLASINLGGFLHDAGQPFADRVDLDDWTHDARPDRWEQVQFAGDRYMVPLEWAKETPQFRASGLQDNLHSTRPEDMESGGASKLAAKLSGRRGHSSETFHDLIELMDVWLPNEKLLLTFPPEWASPLPLRILEFSEPESGPYHLLGFNPVPNNIMPLPPVSLWIDLHRMANRLFVKSGRQAERQKTLTVVSSQGINQAQDLIDASDGDAIRNDFPERIKEVRMGGPENAILAMFMMAKGLFNDMAGNPNLLSGLGAQAETFGQDRQNLESANKRIAEMQQRTVRFTKDVTRDLGWYVWNDPKIHKQLIFELPGTDIKVPVVFSAEEREGDFFDYAFDVDPFSMREQTPGSRLAAIAQFLREFILPFRDEMPRQGVSLDLPGLAKIAARYQNISEIKDIIRFTGTPDLDDPAEVGRRKQAVRPSDTTRTNVRVNKGGDPQGQDDAGTIRQLLSGGEGPDILSQVSRRAG